MTLELTHKELVNLIRGTTPPSYHHIYHPYIRLFGFYIGGMRDDWEWNSTALENASEEELLHLRDLLNQ